jgi:hypothetical protein
MATYRALVKALDGITQPQERQHSDGKAGTRERLW